MRTEYDTMGIVQVPDNTYYGAQTQRVVENFPISGKTMPPALIHALGLVKWTAAIAKEAFNTGKTVRKICLEQNILSPKQLAEVLDPMKITKPQETVGKPGG